MVIIKKLEGKVAVAGKLAAIGCQRETIAARLV